MKELKNIEQKLKAHKKEVADVFKVAEIGIFGSVVDGNFKKGSDIDILVSFREPIGLFRFMDLEEYLQKILHRKVDLVSKRALKPYIGRHILENVVYI